MPMQMKKKSEREAKAIDRSEFEALKVELEDNKSARENVRTQIKTAIDAEDDDVAYSLILEWIDLGEAHIDIDKQKLEIYEDILITLSAE